MIYKYIGIKLFEGALFIYDVNLRRRVLLKKVNCRFINQKKFYNDTIIFKGTSSFKPIIQKNYFYGYAGIGIDYYMLTAEMKDIQYMMNKEIIKVYIQFNDFFLIKGYDETIYIISNCFFKENLNNLHISELIFKAITDEKFFKLHTKLIHNMLKESMKFVSYNENICIGFDFNSVFFDVNFKKMLVKYYCYAFNNNGDFFDIVDVYIFKDIILVHDIANNCLSIYENIFSLYIIKDKNLFYNELINFINLYYKKYH